MFLSEGVIPCALVAFALKLVPKIGPREHLRKIIVTAKRVTIDDESYPTGEFVFIPTTLLNLSHQQYENLGYPNGANYAFGMLKRNGGQLSIVPLFLTNSTAAEDILPTYPKWIQMITYHAVSNLIVLSYRMIIAANLAQLEGKFYAWISGYLFRRWIVHS